MKDRFWNLVVIKQQSQRNRLRSFTSLERKAVSHGLICPCGLHVASSSHSQYPLSQHSPSLAKSTFRLKIITTCEVSDVTSEWHSALPIDRLDGFKWHILRSFLSPKKCCRCYHLFSCSTEGIKVIQFMSLIIKK